MASPLTADTAQTHRWPRFLLTFGIAFFAVCPVLAHLVGAYISDGNTFAIVLTIDSCILASMAVAAVRIGLSMGNLSDHYGLVPALTCMVLFWGYWLCINILSPSTNPDMGKQVYHALFWIIMPLSIGLMWSRWLQVSTLFPCMIVLCAVFILALCLRWAMGEGTYKSGRWHPGMALGAISSGRYACMSLWVFVLACLCPASIVPRWAKILSLCCMAPSLLMMVASNARGPWLALAATCLLTAVPLSRFVLAAIRRDTRILVGVVMAVVCCAGLLIWQIGNIDSDFSRLFTIKNDGGSAEGRLSGAHDHLQLLVTTPLGILSGFGYGHGLFYPHNVTLEALINGGILLLCFWLGMVATAVYIWMVRIPSTSVPGLLVFGLFCQYLIGTQVSSNIATDFTWYFPLLLSMRAAKRPEGDGPLHIQWNR